MSRSIIAVVLTFLLLFGAWLLLVSNIHYQELIAGGLIALALAVFLSGMLPAAGRGNTVKRILMFPVLFLILLKEMILANFDVAYRVLHPKMPIRPGIVKVEPGIHSDMGKLVLANSITLTPGTLSMDYIDNSLYIHWIYVKDDDIEASMRPLDKAVKGVFP
ncbi:MAG: Na+/H+ antiporter subunit E [Candidatus Thermoplasmatota archaeon]|nr:Na+/H+ antiporter subunit E [Candidatus Thermoplasmatota archaeon]